MSYKFYSLATCLFASLFFISCDPCNLDRESLINSGLGISVFDSTSQKYFYPEIENRSVYKKDSLKVFDENGRRFPFVTFSLNNDPRNSLNRIYNISIRPAFWIPDDNDAFVNEKTKMVRLQYNSSTSDTLLLVFKGKKLKCNSSLYEYLKVYHPGRLISSVSNTTFAVFTLNH